MTAGYTNLFWGASSLPHTFGPGDPDDLKVSATPRQTDKQRSRAADKRRKKAKQVARRRTP